MNSPSTIEYTKPFKRTNEHNDSNIFSLSIYMHAFRLPFTHRYIHTYLRNSTEVEDTLVANARHVADDVWHVLQCISDEEVEAVYGCSPVLRQS